MKVGTEVPAGEFPDRESGDWGRADGMPVRPAAGSGKGVGNLKRQPMERAGWGGLRQGVFWPPFLLLLAAVILNLASPAEFGRIMKSANSFLLDWFGWLYVLCAFGSLGLCVWVAFSGFGRVRLGGETAKPLMGMWNWFSITVCTTIAVGILFWSTAEPLSHYHHPPESAGVPGASPDSARFAVSALYLHWTFVPYAVYCVASLTFAFAHYNMRLPFSLGSTLVPVLGLRAATRAGGVVDAVCLYSLVAGMAAALGTSILTISGGLESLWGVPRSAAVWGVIALAIVTVFVLSSASGLMRGIRILSDINARGLFVLGAVVFAFGPMLYILRLGLEGLVGFGFWFAPVGLYSSLFLQEEWSRMWSVFYWAVWLAWTPVTACFLGQIAYGRTVREFLLVNLLLPSLFGMVWMAVFAGTTLHLESQGAGLFAEMRNSGPESVSYAVLRSLPAGFALVVFYLFSAFVCFVTSADSNTTAMAAISSKSVTRQNPEGPLAIKVAWGLLTGTTAWVMIAFADVEGIRMLSTLGGFPAAILVLLMMLSLARVLCDYRKLDRTDGADRTTL